MTTADEVLAVARQAREAAARLAPLPRAAKDTALAAMADALVAATPQLLAANARDVERDADNPLVDRLRLDEQAGRGDGGRPASGRRAARSGRRGGARLDAAQRPGAAAGRVPFGVVGIIYEARPNVTVDAAGLCLKSGNAVLLRGSSSARDSNPAIVEVLAAAATEAGLPEHSVQLVPGDDHESVKDLMQARGLVDVLIPRGGAEPDPQRGRGVDGAGDRDRCRQLPRVRRCRRRPGHGDRDHAQRQGPAAQRLQRGRDDAGPHRRRRRVPSRRARTRCGTPG